MDEKPEKKRRRSGVLSALLVATVLILYPLSEGPAAYCVTRGWLPHSVFVAYLPWAWVTERFPERIQQCRGNYVLWWMTLAYRRDFTR